MGSDMLLTRPTSSLVEGQDPATFWSLFEHSRVPMALVNRDRRYVDINDAGLELFQYRREDVIDRRVALGASTRQIAADLYLSPATVRSHVRNAMVKTNSHTRAQLVALVLGDVLRRG